MPLYVKTIEKEFQHPVDDSKTVNIANGYYVQLDAGRLVIDSSAIASPWNVIKTLADTFYMRSEFEAMLNHTITVDRLSIMYPCVFFVINRKCYISAIGTQVSGWAPSFPLTSLEASGLITDFSQVDPDQFVAWERFFLTVPFYNRGASYVFAHEFIDRVANLDEQDVARWCWFYRDRFRLDLPLRKNSGDIDWNTYYSEDVPPYRTPTIPVLNGFPAFYLYPTKMDNLDYGSSLRYVLPGLTKSLTERERQQVYLDPYKGVVPIDSFSTDIGE